MTTEGAGTEVKSTHRPADRPLHRWLYRELEGSLAQERLRPGSRLPSEREIGERYQVSRVTVRKALEALEADGFVESSKGLGWFVTQPKPNEMENELTSFTEMAAARGLVATSRVIVSRLRPATIDEAEALRIAPGADLAELERVRMLDGLPVVVDWSVLPASRFPGLLDRDFETTSLYQTLESAYGCSASGATYTMQAVAADSRQAELLGVDPGAPILSSAQVAFDQDGLPIQLCLFSYRGDRYRMQVRLGKKR